MAVRTSFTAGEVLAAADLTDTFGSKATVSALAAKLDISGDDSLTINKAAPTIVLRDTGASQSATFFTQNNNELTMDLTGYVNANNSLKFNTGNGTRLVVTSGGFFNFNKAVTESYARLDVFEGTTTTSRALRVNNTNASLASSVMEVNADRAANTGYQFFIASSAAATTPDTEFVLRGDGNGYCDGSWNGGGADYAEMFEWLDGNPTNEDRRGLSVTLEGNKIKPAQTGDTIIGVISGNPSVIGDTAWNKWSGKYLTDDYGSYIMEDYEVYQWTTMDDQGETVEHYQNADTVPNEAPQNAAIVTQTRRSLNPNYNPDTEYISRENRPEWSAVGLMGKLRLRKNQPTNSTWVKMSDISETIEEWLIK